jgi:hypothetical protein
MLQALGNLVIVDPTPDKVKIGSMSFNKNEKINKGILKSKGSGCPKELKEGDVVYFLAGKHREIQQLLIMNGHKSLVGYERS